MYNLYPPEWRGPKKPNLIQRFVAWLAGDPSVLDEWRPGPWPDPEPERGGVRMTTADRPDTAPDVGLSEAVAEALAEHDGMPWLFGDENIPTLTKDERAVYLARAAAVLTAVEAAHARDHAALRERAEVAEATPPEHRPDPDERQYPDPLQDPHGIRRVRVAHAEHTRSGYGPASLCGTRTGYTVPEQGSVTCSTCKAMVSAASHWLKDDLW